MSHNGRQGQSNSSCDSDLAAEPDLPFGGRIIIGPLVVPLHFDLWDESTNKTEIKCIGATNDAAEQNTLPVAGPNP